MATREEATLAECRVARMPSDRPAPHSTPTGSPSRSEERLRLALEVAGIGKWELDLENGTAFRSLLHDQIFGYETLLPEWTYEMFLLHVVPEDREAVDAAFQLATAQQTEWDFECRIRRADNAVRWIWARGRVWRRRDGEPTRMLGVVADITDRKAPEAALRESERRFQRAVAEAPFPVLLHADDGEVLQVSRAFTEITGYSLADVPTIGDWTERAYGDRRQAVREVIDRLFDADRRVDEGEFVVRTQSGAERVWAFSSAPLGRDGDGRRLAISMAADVTERKQAEQEVRHMSARMIQATECERRRVARELHDELGGLLTSLQMSLKMNPAQEAGARDELAASERLVRAMIDKVRDLSLDLRPSLLDDLGLTPALDQLVARFEARTHIQVDLHTELAEDERFAPEIETTAYRVVQEALTNVARHTRVQRVQVLCHREPDRLVLHVSDDGPGFEPDDVDVTRSSGLVGMRERAALAGGVCEIATAPGSGTRVTVSLPA